MASTSSFRASSSSSTPAIPRTSTYDVFLSFRGEDTRYNFTDHLYSALGRRGIHTFRDDKLRRGEAIAPELLKAIEESRSSVIVFSENYAHSRWCLDELVKIMECQKDQAHVVIPIFYHVDPSHVRKQEGSFGEAFAGYEENWKDKIPRWRTALTEAANLSGWHIDGYESNQIKEITASIYRRLKCKRLDAGDNLVGMDSHVKEMILRLHMESSDVRIVGIYGVGGIGKTTIAKVIYNKLSCEFECMSFLENIREIFNTKDLSPLQNQLLVDILEGEGNQNINGVARRASMIEANLLAKRAFIVLDDVDDVDQLEYLLGHRKWLGEGSRVIITTRNKHVLAVQEVDDLYEVKGLNFEEACELFSLYAFKQNHPKSDYRNLSRRVVGYCQGLPLALKVLGSLLFKKTIPQWESELNKLDREPAMKIHNVLKRSYDGLDRTVKKIFLDVACFLKGENRDSVSRILDGCDFHAEGGIRNLNDLCLITLPHNQICMHDLIQQMGWEIVREKFPDEPNQWSRLWDPRDIQQALGTSKEIPKAQTISLDLSKLKRVCFNSNVFAKMTSLRLLKVHSGVYYHHLEGIREKDYYAIIKNTSKMRLDMKFEFPYELRYLYWDGYPLDFLPSNFDGEKLVELHLKCSNIKQLWQGHKDLERLKVIDLSCSRNLIQMSEFSSMPNLERLILEGCVSLINIHPSVGNMKKLTTLSLRFCDQLKNLPDSIGDLESLETLNLSDCSKFEIFPEKGGKMKSLKVLNLKNTAIKDLPDGIGHLESLDLSDCSKFEKFPEKGGNMKSLKRLNLRNTAIKDLPDSIGDLESLETLDLSDCSKFEKFPEKGGNMKSLKWLYLINTAIKDLPDSIGDLESLETLDLSDCSKFEKFPEKGGNMKSLKWLYLINTAIKDLPDSIGDLESLESLDLSDCSKFEKFPEKGGNMKSLKWLDLRNTAIKDLPDSIGDLESLGSLDLSNCSKFEKFPEKGGNMKSLKRLDLRNTAIKDLPDSIGDLESLESLDLFDCSKFEKFPEKGGNMKSLKWLDLRNTAIKDLPDSIGDLESLESLDLSDCSKFEKFPEKGGNMKRLWKLSLKNTAIKDLPDSIGDLESLSSLDLSDCSKFEKFPEKGGNMKSLKKLHLQNTAIKDLPTNISRFKILQKLILGGCSDLWEGLISNLQKLNISQCKMAGQILVLPSSLQEIDAYHCTSKEDLSGLLWLCHLNWLKSTTEELKCWKLGAVIPESNGIPEWIRYQNMGSEVTTELPTNWYEDPHFLGFVVSCVYRHNPTSDYCDLECELNLHGNGFEFKDDCWFQCRCEAHGNFKHLRDRVCIWWYPKIAIPKEHHHKYTHINASFRGKWTELNLKKCGINLIFAGDQQNHMPMLEHPQNSGDNGSALQDTDGNVHGANQDDEHYHIPMLLDLLGNFGDIGSVILEGTDGNRKRRRDDSDVIAHASKMQLDRGFKFPSYELRYLCWDGYPLDFLPSNFDGGKLVELHLKCSNIKRLWLGNKDLERLKVIDLSYSRKLIQMSEFSRMPNLESLLLNGCVSLIDIHPSVGNLKKLTTLSLRSCDKLKNLPDSIWDSESLEILDLSYCSKFEKFPEKGGNMKSLARLYLRNTAIKDLPDSIGDLESLEYLDLSDCSKFEKFPEKGGNMKSLERLYLRNTAIKDLPDSIGDLESLEYLDLSDCSKFEKFPEKGGNMKSLKWLNLKNTAIKDLPDSIGDLESLVTLDLPYCSKFEKFPEKGGNMKSLIHLDLRYTAIKDLPTNISRLKNLKRLILGGCSDLWEGLISNQLCNLQKLNISQCKMAGQILVLPSSLEEIDAYDCKEDLSGLLWLCHLNWLKSTTEELKCWKLGAVIPESNGIPEWIRYQNMGSEVTTELPTNWYEDPDFLGFVVSCVSRHIPKSDFGYWFLDLECELNLHGNGFEFKDKCRHTFSSDSHGNFKDLRDQVWVWWYPKIAIPKEHHHKYTHINASFRGCKWREINLKKCGINLIFAGDQQNHMPMLEHPQNSGDNGSALQDTDGNVRGANQDDEHYLIPMLLDLPGNFGDIGSVILEGTDGNRKRRRDDSLPDVVEEPHYKRLGAPNTHLSL